MADCKQEIQDSIVNVCAEIRMHLLQQLDKDIKIAKGLNVECDKEMVAQWKDALMILVAFVG